MESQENYNKYMRGCSKQLLSSSFVCVAECFKKKTNLGVQHSDEKVVEVSKD